MDSNTSEGNFENGEGSGGLAHMAPEERLQLEREAFQDVKERLEEEKRQLEAENKALRTELEESSTDARTEPTSTRSGLEGVPPLPNVYSTLPSLLQNASSTFQRRYERDVFLTAALPALGAIMPNVRGYYGHVPESLSPHFYTAIVAGAAGGKGTVKWARRLVKEVDQSIKKAALSQIQEWERRKEQYEAEGNVEGSFGEPKPPKQSLFLPANTSAAAFHEGLKERDERAFVIETEIDTMLNALGQEWGKYDDTLRKAYHHEPTSYRRKGEGSVELDDPRLSVVLSGTPGQFSDLMGSSENGLYSRFALYYFEAPPVWISQKPTQRALDLIDRFEGFASRVEEMYNLLEQREPDDPLRFRLTDEQWTLHETVLQSLMHEAVQGRLGHMSDVYKRAGVVAFRIAMTLTILRAFEQNVPLATADELEAKRADVETGLELARTYADHSVRFAEDRLDEVKPPDASSYRIAVMLQNVSTFFSSGDAYRVAHQKGINASNRTLRRDLKKAESKGLIRPRGDNGTWEKVEVGIESNMSEVSDSTNGV